MHSGPCSLCVLFLGLSDLKEVHSAIVATRVLFQLNSIDVVSEKGRPIE